MALPPARAAEAATGSARWRGIMRATRLSRGTWFLLLLLAAFFGAFLIYPLGFMLRRAFWVEGRFTLEYFGLILASPLEREAIGNSLLIATGTTLAASLLALPLALLLTRVRFRGQGLLGGLLLVPMIMPPFVGAIGMRQLLARFGSVNLLLMDWGLLPPDRPIDWLGQGGFWGIIILQTLSLYPILFLNLSAAMANVDPSLREAARNLGARGWRLFRTVTLPLILPGWFAGASIVFIWSFTDLGTPLIFGFSRVVPVRIFDSISELNTNPSGYALVMLVLLMTAVIFLLTKRLFAVRRHEMMSRGHTGDGEHRATTRQTVLIWLGVGAVLALALLPHVAVVAQSFSERWFFTVLPGRWTLENYAEIAGGGAGVSIRNSLLYASLSASVDLVLGVAIAWLLTRRRIPGATLLDTLAMLPLALPGLVLAFGYVAGFDFDLAWLNPRRNPTLLLVVSYSVRRLPYIVRAAYAGFQQTSVTLEEASAGLGASPWRTLRRITVPLVFANLAAGTVLTFAYAMLEVSDSLILAMQERYFPITKKIYELMGKIEPSAPSVACALGVVGMVILAGSLLLVSRVLGRRMGQLFRM
jgi:iron(III) transport system permease protein